MDEKILIMDLSKESGRRQQRSFGAMIVTKLQLAAMSRTDIPEKGEPTFICAWMNFKTLPRTVLLPPFYRGRKC